MLPHDDVAARSHHANIHERLRGCNETREDDGLHHFYVNRVCQMRNNVQLTALGRWKVGDSIAKDYNKLTRPPSQNRLNNVPC